MTGDPEVLRCFICGHCWYDEDGPPGCPNCRSMNFEVVTWTPADTIKADPEKWNLFDTCRGFDIEGYDENGIPDDHVILHCIVMAVFGGSDLHRRALIFEQATHQHPNPEYEYA